MRLKLLEEMSGNLKKRDDVMSPINSLLLRNPFPRQRQRLKTRDHLLFLLAHSLRQMRAGPIFSQSQTLTMGLQPLQLCQPCHQVWLQARLLSRIHMQAHWLIFNQENSIHSPSEVIISSSLNHRPLRRTISMRCKPEMTNRGRISGIATLLLLSCHAAQVLMR